MISSSHFLILPIPIISGSVAKRFFKKVLRSRHNQKSRVINVDKNAAYPPAFEDLKEEKLVEKDCELRQVKYLNNRVEQDHRAVKRITRAGLGYKSFYTAWRTRRGIEIMHMINNSQIE
jgi:transposase-like protein